jgi:hypothetical protein
LLTFKVPNIISIFLCLWHSRESVYTSGPE